MTVEDPDKKPSLRVVSPDEQAPAPAEKDAPPPASSVAFVKAAESLDAEVPIRAAYLACAGAYLADASLEFYRSAVEHAPPGTWRGDAPPGMRSAEATRAWLGTHLDALKAKAGEPEASTASYKRAKQLQQAAAMAATELVRAHGATQTAGLWYDQRRDDLFRECTGSVEMIAAFKPDKVEVTLAPQTEPQVEPQEEVDIYVLGCQALEGGFRD